MLIAFSRSVAAIRFIEMNPIAANGLLNMLIAFSRPCLP
jgi:hypothetical protein